MRLGISHFSDHIYRASKGNWIGLGSTFLVLHLQFQLLARFLYPVFLSYGFLFPFTIDIFGNFNSWQLVFCKNVSNFWWLTPKLCYKISRNPLRMFIWMQKSIEFYLKHYEIPQPLLRYLKVFHHFITIVTPLCSISCHIYNQKG